MRPSSIPSPDGEVGALLRSQSRTKSRCDVCQEAGIAEREPASVASRSNKQEVVGVQLRNGHSLQRYRVVGVESDHSVSMAIVGSMGLNSGKVGKQRVVELDRVLVGLEVGDHVLAEARSKHKRVG